MPVSNPSDHARGSSVKAIVIAVQLPEDTEREVHGSLAELEQLLLGLGITVTARLLQKRSVRTAPTYLGEGKLRELASRTGGTGEVPRGPARPVDRAPGASDLVVVVDDELAPGQHRNLQAALGVDVLDRTAVILRVFESRARTREARLEVELARLEYELPRIRDDSSLGDREGGGGRASRGHTNVELAKQRARDRIAAVRRELAQWKASTEQRRQARADVFRVALVGYTNAGKSSLMRQLTGSDVLVEDRLFATLGTTVRQLAPPATPAILVADTVGFIHRLPHALVASFHSTLSEAHEAWLLLHVVDCSDPAFRAQRRVTEQVLSDIGAAATPIWLVLNKADRLDPAQRDALAAEHPDAILTSALDRQDGEALRARVEAFFGQHLVEQTVVIPYERHGVLAELRDRLQVVREDYGAAVSVTVRGTPETLARLAARLAPAR
jgi:GTP-binding protein HflX